MRRAIAVVLTAGGVVAAAQGPPVKMGLWEGTRMRMLPGMTPSSITAEVCVTPETWERSIGVANAPAAGCKVTTSKTGNGYTFAGTCVSGQMTMRLSGTEVIEDAEHIHSIAHTSMTANGKTLKTATTSDHHFVSADCGRVRPGAPTILKGKAE